MNVMTGRYRYANQWSLTGALEHELCKQSIAATRNIFLAEAISQILQLTISTVQSSLRSCQLHNRSSSSVIRRNPEVHYKVHEKLPLYSLLTQHNPVHTAPVFKIQNLILNLPLHRDLSEARPTWYFPSSLSLSLLLHYLLRDSSLI
jgi:hypothetical protein